ncbi:MAG: rhomboid family intramembrane serine protease [Bacteroidetes bacterium]|nr:rhomboid family intramembrane serine protease [Bacteroidota bacterium]MBL6943660.1 rhomboid family intramembrane serine protease [Bacteroidales bacterium]
MLPMVVKNLLIINGLFFLATIALDSTLHINLVKYLGLHYPLSHDFGMWQLVSYMFMHGGFAHILFNMFALWMFGNVLENVWGPRRFLNYYLITGIGAGIVQIIVAWLRISSVEADLSPEQIAIVIQQGADVLSRGMNYENLDMGALNLIINTPTVGASGAVFGILLAFGMMFPNSLIYVYFAIPVKAKYFVMIYGAIELYMGFSNNPADNVAHFAHLGGMIFGFFLIMFWKKKGKLNNY